MTIRLLIVDDSEVVRDRLGALLDAVAGVDVVGASSTAEEAYAALERTHPDAIVLDVHAPAVGLAQLERLRELAPEATIIALAGSLTEAHRTRFVESGADYLLDKAKGVEALRRLCRELAHTRWGGHERGFGALQRALIQSSLIGVYRSTPEGRVLDCNQALASMLGFDTVPDLVDVQASSLYANEGGREDFLALLRRERELPLVEIVLRRVDGRELVALENVVGIFDDDGALTEIHGFLVDVTARKEAERSRDVLAGVVRQAAEAIVLTDSEGAILEVNQAFADLTGYSAAEAVGQNPRMLKSGEHDDAFYRELWSTILAGGVWSGRITNRRKDGTLFHVDATISPLRGPDGEIESFIAFEKDISRELELERQLASVQRLDSIGQLASGIAHDFNNLIAAVLANAELAMLDLDPDDALTELLEAIRGAALSGRSLTGQLLAFGRRQLLHPQVIDLNEVVTGVEKMLERILEENVELRLKLDRSTGKVRVDTARLESVVLNLALNARDAMPDGGVLTIESAEVQLDAAYAESHPDARAGRFVMLSVADTGIGMDRETQDRIFEPFFTTKGGHGAGLGLAMVYGTVKQSGGNIWVYSEPGSGTTFKIYLPVQGAEAESVSPESDPPRAERAARILVLDDDDSVRRGTRRILEAAGHVVTAASLPSEALAALREAAEPFDVLVTDMNMPEMRGDELAASAFALQPDLRVLFVSGYAPEAAFGAEIPASRHAYLEKPFTYDELTRAVDALLNECRAALATGSATLVTSEKDL